MARNKDGDTTAPKEKKTGRLAQIWQVFKITRQQDPLVGWYMLLAFLVTFGVIFIVGLLLDLGWIFGIFGVMSGVLVAAVVMSRRAGRGA